MPLSLHCHIYVWFPAWHSGSTRVQGLNDKSTPELGISSAYWGCFVGRCEQDDQPCGNYTAILDKNGNNALRGAFAFEGQTGCKLLYTDVSHVCAMENELLHEQSWNSVGTWALHIYQWCLYHQWVVSHVSLMLHDLLHCCRHISAECAQAMSVPWAARAFAGTLSDRVVSSLLRACFCNLSLCFCIKEKEMLSLSSKGERGEGQQLHSLASHKMQNVNASFPFYTKDWVAVQLRPSFLTGGSSPTSQGSMHPALRRHITRPKESVCTMFSSKQATTMPLLTGIQTQPLTRWQLVSSRFHGCCVGIRSGCTAHVLKAQLAWQHVAHGYVVLTVHA